MPDSVYKVIALVGSSTESWEKAAAVAIAKASKTLRDLRVAKVIEQDVHVEGGKHRVKLELSFKYEGGD
jgi:flavin-binding protein dodecin